MPTNTHFGNATPAVCSALLSGKQIAIRPCPLQEDCSLSCHSCLLDRDCYDDKCYDLVTK